MQQMRSNNSYTVNKNVFSLFLNVARLMSADLSSYVICCQKSDSTFVADSMGVI